MAQQSQPDVSAYVDVVTELASQLMAHGYPDLSKCSLHQMRRAHNAVVMDPLEAYVWIDDTSKPPRAYSIYGISRTVPDCGPAIDVTDFTDKFFAETRFLDGSFWNSGLSAAFIPFVIAGRTDVLPRIIKRDLLYRTPTTAIRSGLMLSVYEPRFNLAAMQFSRGNDREARRALLPLLDWLLNIGDGLAGAQERAQEELRKISDQSFSLAGELRRRIREGPKKPFDPKVLSGLPAEKRIDYLINHLDESKAILIQPGGAGFLFGGIPRALVNEGESALPALRRVVATDPRLTRVVYDMREGVVYDTYSVAEVARRIIRAIEDKNEPTSLPARATTHPAFVDEGSWRP